MEVVDALLGFGGHGPLDPSYVCIHETAGPGAPAANLLAWWGRGEGLPVHYVGDWTGRCYRCVPEDEVCWQVGNGNPYVVGIELCHATDAGDFDRVWRLGVEWAAWQLSKRGWGTDRLISHRMAAERWGGSDHTDPDGYFEEFGRSWDEFVADVAAELKRGGGSAAGDEGEEGGPDMKAEALIYIDDKHEGYLKGDILYWSPEAGFCYLEHPDCAALVETCNPGIAKVHSSKRAPWVVRARQATNPAVAKATYGKRD